MSVYMRALECSEPGRVVLCKDCKFRGSDRVTAESLCFNERTAHRNFVTGDVEGASCYDCNRDGKCPLWEPKGWAHEYE